MEVIRVGVFETNSSSTHSICVRPRDARGRDTLPVDALGTCRVYPGEFGWEVEEFDDAPTKASYCLTHLKNARNYRDGGDRFTGDLLRYREQMLKEVIAEATGAKLVVFVQAGEDDDGHEGWGYIDHQSIEYKGGACEPAWQSKETLADFIFNRSSVLRTDNDNH